jgi:hypothetical protein
MSAHRQIQRRRRGIFVENAAQTISSSVGAAYFDVAPDGAENDFISILQVYRADGAAEERTTSASVATAEESSVVQLTPIAAGTGKPASISARKSLAKRTQKKTGSCARSLFDAVVNNPPFSYRWEPKEDMSDDVRFKNYGLAPKSAADFAFLLHGFHLLKDQGVMAIILPHGVLFRGGKEEEIRTKLLKDGHIDTVIGLPPKLFYSTGIPVCILVLKKVQETGRRIIHQRRRTF